LSLPTTISSTSRGLSGEADADEAGSQVMAYEVPRRSRRLQAVDTLLRPPPPHTTWSPGAGQTQTTETAEETACASPRSGPRCIVASTCTPAPWSLGLWKQDGESVPHRKLQAAPAPFLEALAPSPEDLVVGVARLFTWSWLADVCAREGLPVVLGPALSMNAIHGGHATHGRIDAQNIAARRRGGRPPQADVSPSGRRATRELLRRRRHVLRQGAE
jgi:hypothetical protein